MDLKAEAVNDTFFGALKKKLQQRHEAQIDGKEELLQKKQLWYQAVLLQSALESLSLEAGSSEADDNNKIAGIIGDRLVRSECELITRSCEKSQILSVLPSVQQPLDQDTSKKVKRAVQEHLTNKLVTISNFYQPSPSSTGESLVHAKALQICNVVGRDIQMVESSRESIEAFRAEQMSLNKTLLKAYTDALTTCDLLLSKYKYSIMVEKEQKTAQFLSVKAEAISKKLGLINSQILVDTYTPDVISQLHAIRERIYSLKTSTAADLAKAEHSYKLCLSAGTDFRQMAKEYADIQKAIKARTWALDELESAKLHIKKS